MYSAIIPTQYCAVLSYKRRSLLLLSNAPLVPYPLQVRHRSLLSEVFAGQALQGASFTNTIPTLNPPTIMVESLNVRNDSLISNPEMASSATLRLAGELGAQLQSLLLQLNFSFSKVAIEESDDISVQVEEYDTEFFNQEGRFNP